MKNSRGQDVPAQHAPRPVPDTLRFGNSGVCPHILVSAVTTSAEARPDKAAGRFPVRSRLLCRARTVSLVRVENASGTAPVRRDVEWKLSGE